MIYTHILSCDYIEEINKNLSHNSKFKCLGTTENNNTAKIEDKLQKQLLKLIIKDELPWSVYKFICPTGAQKTKNV